MADTPPNQVPQENTGAGWVELYEDWEFNRTYKGLTGIRSFRQLDDGEVAPTGASVGLPNIGDYFADPLNATPIQVQAAGDDTVASPFSKLLCLKIKEKKWGKPGRTKLVCEYGYPEDEDVSDIVKDTTLITFPNNLELSNEYMRYNPESSAWLWFSDASNVTDPLVARITTAKWYFVKCIQNYDKALDVIRPMLETVNKTEFGRLSSDAVVKTFGVWTLLFEGVKFKFFLNHNQQERWMVTFSFLYKEVLGLGDANIATPGSPVGWCHQMRPDGNWDVPCFGGDTAKRLYAESEFGDLYALT